MPPFPPDKSFDAAAARRDGPDGIGPGFALGNDQETIGLLRMTPRLDTAAAPRVERLIERLGRMGAMVGELEPDTILAGPSPLAQRVRKHKATDDPAAFPTIPDFRLLKVLGEGGMGIVYLAEETALARRVALKLIRRGVAASPDAHVRFMREARAMAAVVHDNVMPVHRVGECEAGMFFTMPLLPGKSLAERLDETTGPLPNDETLDIFRQIAAGLQAIHAQGLVHRDIKPSNIWLQQIESSENKGCRVRILDFGVALDIAPDATTRTAAILGTPGFMAPEQAAGTEVDARADLFSLGAVGYRMWTGRSPFAGESLFALLTQLALRDPPLADSVNAAVPRNISQLLTRLLEKDPTDRPASAADVLGTLSAVRETPKRIGLSKNVRTLAAFAFVAAVVAGIVITVVNKRGERATVTLPDGADAEVGPDGSIQVRVPGDGKPDRPAAVLPFPALDAKWLAHFQTLDAAGQRDEIGLEMQRRNPGYFDKPYYSEADAKPKQLSDLGFFTDRVRDVAPVAAAKMLTHLRMNPTGWEHGAKGRLNSLEAVRGLHLQYLDIYGNPEVIDLSPLAGMRLNWLDLRATGVRSLEPLRKVELDGGLLIEKTAVSDLSPIAGQALAEVWCADTAVRDLKPLAGMKLYIVTIPAGAAPWTVLADMPLAKLRFTPDKEQDVNIFRRMKTLKEINGQPAEAFWREFDQGKNSK